MQSSLGLPQIRSVPEPRFAYLARGLVPDAGHLQRTFGRGLAFDFYSPFQYLSAGGGSLGGPLSIQATLVRLDDLTVLWADSCSFDAGSFPPPLLFSRIANVEQLYTPAALDRAAGCGDTLVARLLGTDR